MIEFLLGMKKVQLFDVDPNLTLLNYLRSQHFVGTKEGCASGDCGACTVVVASLEGDRLVYESVNSCLLLIANVHAKQVITVEMLKQGQSLHPVQQALVTHHASQCGYCTPGFVMSMFALNKNHPQASKEQILEGLAGNLCRCTGYRPIVDAALSLSDTQVTDSFIEQTATTIAELKAMAQNTQLGQKINQGQLEAWLPTTTQELLELLAEHPDAQLIAGGTDLSLEVTQKHQVLPKLIHLHLIEEMKKLEEHPDHLVIGANVSLTQVSGLLEKHFPSFKALLERFASLQIRNQGTLGGNIANASPIGDSPPCLIALGASLQLASLQGRREMLLEDFFLDYKKTALQSGECIEAIIIPKLNQDDSVRDIYEIYKVSKRMEDDISAVCGAFHIQVKGKQVVTARIAYGGMAAIPKRAIALEQALVGQTWQLESIEKAMSSLSQDFTPLSDMRASKEYRMQVAQNLLMRVYLEDKNRNEPAFHQDLQVSYYE